MVASVVRRVAAAALIGWYAGVPAQGSGGQTARIVLNTAAATGTYAPELFGVNWNWVDNGSGLIEHGELVHDRSFRNQKDAAKRAWLESPNKEGNGRIARVDGGGDEHPWGGRGYPGYLRLSQHSQGYTCVSQRVYDAVEPGQDYELRVSARRESGGPGL